MPPTDSSERLAALDALASPCRLCPRACGVSREHGELGACGVGASPVLSSFGPHHGEERELVGWGGSGTIFVAGCNLGCCFCQNPDISHACHGRAMTVEQVAQVMSGLQRQGCHNINLVSPTHFAPALVRAYLLARKQGLTVPLVYNCGGYESVEVLRLLEGVVDLYMPDAKWWRSEPARRYASAPDYPEVLAAALIEMHRQVGVLRVDDRGVATRGLLVRHLVMPGGQADTVGVLEFIANELSTDAYVNVMAQYRPCHAAYAHPPLHRRLLASEYAAAVAAARRLGLNRGLGRGL